MSREKPGIYTVFPEGIRISIAAKPGLTRERPPRVVAGADGASVLEVCVSARPQDGKANKAIMAYLAKWLGIKVADIRIKAGQTGRVKIIEACGDPAALRQRMDSLLAE